MRGLIEIKTVINTFCSDSEKSELEVIEALKKFYFNKALKDEIKLYKKGKKKVAQITKDLKISHQRFYKILEEKNIEYTKYKKSK